MELTSDQHIKARTIQLKSLFSNAYSGIGAGIIIAFFLVWFMYDHIKLSYLLSWLVYMVCGSSFRAGVIFYSHNKNSEYSKLEKCLNLYILSTFFVGLGWGGTVFFMFSPVASVQQVSLILVLMGICTGALASLGSVQKAFYSFISPILIPLAVRFLTDEHPSNKAYGLICIVYMAFILIASSKFYKSILESIRFSIISNDLADHLKTEKEKVEDVNRELISEIEHNQRIENELRFAKNLAEESNIAKQNVLQNMTHEFRTPMNGILGMTQVLLETPLNENQRRNLLTLQSSSQRLYQLLENLLINSEINSKEIIVKQNNFQLLETIQKAVREYQIQSHQKGLELTEHYDELTSSIVYSDPGLLSRVLKSLLDNAIKFTERGTIGISVNVLQKKHNQCLFSFRITDTGIGIAEEKLDEIFESLSQLDQSKTRKFRGAGLGLSIAKKVVKLLGGEIRASSELGKGTEINFSIPLVIAAKKQEEKQELCILLAEDSSVSQNLAKIVFKKLGHKLTLVNNGEEAVLAAKNEKFDLIFMDLSMPVLGGLEATRKIREFDEDIPIIGLSGSEDGNEIEECTKVGMNGFQTKPYHAKKLATEISRFFSISATPKELSPEIDSSDQDSSDFSSIKGIDFDAGLKRWGGNQKVYIDALQQFAKEHYKDSEKLDKFCATKNYKELKSLAHAIKGVGKNLSATVLSTTTQNLEKAASQSDTSAIEGLVVEVKKALEDLIDSIGELEIDIKELSPKADNQADVLTKAEIKENLNNLQDAINKGEAVVAADLTQRLFHGGYATEETEKFRLLLYQIENFEFTDAVKTLNQITEKAIV